MSGNPLAKSSAIQNPVQRSGLSRRLGFPSKGSPPTFSGDEKVRRTTASNSPQPFLVQDPFTPSRPSSPVGEGPQDAFPADILEKRADSPIHRPPSTRLPGSWFESGAAIASSILPNKFKPATPKAAAPHTPPDPKPSSSTQKTYQTSCGNLAALYVGIATWTEFRDGSRDNADATRRKLETFSQSLLTRLGLFGQASRVQALVVGFGAIACLTGAFVATPLGLLLVGATALTFLAVQRAVTPAAHVRLGNGTLANAPFEIFEAETQFDFYEALVREATRALEDARAVAPGAGAPPAKTWAHQPLERLEQWLGEQRQNMDAQIKDLAHGVREEESRGSATRAIRRLGTAYGLGALQVHRSFITTILSIPAMAHLWFDELKDTRHRARRRAEAATAADNDEAGLLSAAERIALRRHRLSCIDAELAWLADL